MPSLDSWAHKAPNAGYGKSFWLVLLLAFGALLIGGSLYPFRIWHPIRPPSFNFLWAPITKNITRTDILTNFLIYLPFGALLAKTMLRRMSIAGWLLVCSIGIAFSASMEFLQAMFRYRVTSNLDVAFNSLGTAVGALSFPLLDTGGRFMTTLISFRQQWLRPGWSVAIGSALVTLWTLSQFSLQTPSLIAGSLKAGFRPFWETMHADSTDWLTVLILAVEIASISLLTATFMQARRYSWLSVGIIAIGAILLKFIAAAFLVKLAIFPRLLSWDILFGLTGGLALSLLAQQRHKDVAPLHYVAVLLGTLALAKLFRGLPFITATGLTPDLANQPEVLVNITGVAYLVAEVWPYLALGYILGRMGGTKTA